MGGRIKLTPELERARRQDSWWRVVRWAIKLLAALALALTVLTLWFG